MYEKSNATVGCLLLVLSVVASTSAIAKHRENQLFFPTKYPYDLEYEDEQELELALRLEVVILSCVALAFFFLALICFARTKKRTARKLNKAR